MIGLGFVLARMGLFLRQLAVTTAAAGLAPAGDNPLRTLHAGHEFLVSGVVFLAVGTALGVWSGWLYDRNRRSIDAGRFEPARGSVLALTAVVVLGSLVIIGLVVWRVVEE
jgi:putative membrane protein